KPERTQYAWSGLQMVGETSDTHPDAAVQYIYTENSYEPLARVDSHGEHADIFWYHTEINGLPDSVTDSHGDTVWRGASTAWGRSLRESTPVNWDTPQNLRFQGQYLDRETGLHYNTFRYYDPAGGCYTQMDPIGLLGGLNTYTYVVDPLGWVDPLGLAGCNVKFRSRNAAFRAAKRDAGILMKQSPDKIYDPKTGHVSEFRHVLMTDSHGDTILNSAGKPIWTREYQFTRTDGSKVIIQDHSAGHSYPNGVGDQGPHINIRPIDNIRTGHVPGTSDHYDF
ncbi:HNH/endonuclease VII fold putative polymorphic toxin, partial [Kosakonia cowanii]|uniref:HNH/endonuclease VII fold putative polymorphic toxin n=1 Tax=Kosakonia cowanii TaxID=208223 RepID=UPI0040638017